MNHKAVFRTAPATPGLLKHHIILGFSGNPKCDILGKISTKYQNLCVYIYESMYRKYVHCYSGLKVSFFKGSSRRPPHMLNHIGTFGPFCTIWDHLGPIKLCGTILDQFRPFQTKFELFGTVLDHLKIFDHIFTISHREGKGGPGHLVVIL